MKDEFDDEQPQLVNEGLQQHNISGHTSIDAINQRFGLMLQTQEVDLIVGLMMHAPTNC